jgi:hypothetical protein
MLPLIQFYIDIYEKNENKFMFLCNSVSVKILSGMCNRFIADGDVIDLFDLPKEKIQEYIELGEKYSKENVDKLDVMKSAYAIELITSNV